MQTRSRRINYSVRCDSQSRRRAVRRRGAARVGRRYEPAPMIARLDLGGLREETGTREALYADLQQFRVTCF
jgi:hypothetical protein